MKNIFVLTHTRAETKHSYRAVESNNVKSAALRDYSKLRRLFHAANAIRILMFSLVVMATLSVGVQRAGATTVTEYEISVDDYAVLRINGSVVASYDSIPWGSAYGSVNLPTGWYSFELTYKNRFGSTALRFSSRSNPSDPWEIVPLSELRSLDSSGVTIQGLRADYFTLAGAPLGTIYGEGPISHGWLNLYEGQIAPWAGGLVDTNWGLFEERLTGEIHVTSRAAGVPDGGVTFSLLAASLISMFVARVTRRRVPQV